MCGITGIYRFNNSVDQYEKRLEASVATLNKRGPDHQECYLHKNTGLGHARLSIIDTSNAAHQPFHDASGKYVIVFNGEIYNYQSIRKELEDKGYTFKTSSDTEVLLYAFIEMGEACLDRFNGFYAFAILNKETNELFVARDKIGIKPLYFYQDEQQFIFGSELKAIMAFDIEKKIDQTSLINYLQFCYIPEPFSIFEKVQKLKPGHFIRINGSNVEQKRFYKIPYGQGLLSNTNSKYTFSKTFYDLMHASVEKRLIADVPIGAFLSGGVDSSIIVACASKFKKDLNTFSIGYKDEPHYDETKYAELVAKHFGTNHTTFSLSNDDLFESLNKVLDYTDEPFADSSALAVNILCEHTRSKATVALSGDGGDELFAGYNKHRAEFMMRNGNLQTMALKMLSPALKRMPQSRASGFGNKVRQMNKFNAIRSLSPTDRYWEFCTFASLEDSQNLAPKYFNESDYLDRKANIIRACHGKDFNEFLRNDMEFVLVNDMLVKVDRMSMSHSLEVRVPFLDADIVEFAFQLGEQHKINGAQQKIILQQAFKDELPQEIFTRPKHGFEVPLLKWFQNELSDDLTNKWFNEEKIREQGIFSFEAIQDILQRLNSNNPGDTPLDVWKLIVFQKCFDKFQ